MSFFTLGGEKTCLLASRTAASRGCSEKKKVRATSPSPSISPLPVNRVHSTGDAAHPSLPRLAYVATVADPVATSERIAGRVRLLERRAGIFDHAIVEPSHGAGASS